MKKMHFFGLLALALVLALSMAFVGCSSDSDDDRPEVVGTDYLRIPGKYNTQTAEMIISHNARAAGGYVIENDDYYVFRYYDGSKTGDVISRGRITFAAPHITFRPDDGTASFNGYYSEGKVTFAYGNSAALWVADDNTGGGSVGPGVTTTITPTVAISGTGIASGAANIARGATLSVTVTVGPATLTNKAFEWSLDDTGTAADGTPVADGNVTISTTSASPTVVTVDMAATATEKFILKATSDEDNTVAAQVLFTITDPAAVAISITSPASGTVDLAVGGALPFTATVASGTITWTATHNDGSTDTVLDDTGPDPAKFVPGATPFTTATLTLGNAVAGDTITVVASADDDLGGASTATVVVTVVPPPPGDSLTFIVDEANGEILATFNGKVGIDTPQKYTITWSGGGIATPISEDITGDNTAGPFTTSTPIDPTDYDVGSEITCTVITDDPGYVGAEIVEKITIYKVVVTDPAGTNDATIKVNSRTAGSGTTIFPATIYGEATDTITINVVAGTSQTELTSLMCTKTGSTTKFTGTYPITLSAGGDDVTYDIAAGDVGTTPGTIEFDAVFN